MKYILTLLIIGFGSSLFAQKIVDTHQNVAHTPLQDVHMEELHQDAHSGTSIVWAPVGFNKDRMGAAVREQIIILDGQANFTFNGKTTKVNHGAYIVIPANTSHQIEVVGEQPLKMLVLQDAS